VELERIISWIVCLVMLIGWAVMAAADCLPEYWSQITIAVVTFMYGLPQIVNAGSKIVNQLKK